MTHSPPPRMTQVERSQRRKALILREAQRLFGQYGFRGAKLADIAQAAGLTEPGLLHHFPSKAHVLMGLLHERDQADRQRLDDAIGCEPSQILASLQGLMEYNQTIPGVIQLFTTLVAESIERDHPAHDYFIHRYENLRRTYSIQVQAAQDAGVIRTDIPADELVTMIFALMDGLQIQWLLAPDQVDMSRIFTAFARMVEITD